ncbi:MAG: nuclear transport factor 2 family protein [Pseudomonadota bacterium]
MPTSERVQGFVAVVVSGDHVGAIRDYYWDDASMRENMAEPRRGREFLMAHEAKALSRLARMHTHPPKAVMIDGDRVVIHWVFDATDPAGVTRRLEELALQNWRGDRIQAERFFYDTATAWRAVEADDPGVQN